MSAEAVDADGRSLPPGDWGELRFQSDDFPAAELGPAWRDGWYHPGDCGRVLADGFDCAYLCDIAVHPRLQGTGLGQALVGQLVNDARHHQKIILYAVPGKESFYRKFGFLRMLTAMAIFQERDAAIARGHLAED